MAPELDIIIPVYNEGANIRDVLTALYAGVRTPFRVLICYDRDDDNTLSALRAYAAPFAIAMVKNRGAGAHGAVLTGFQESVAPAVLVFAADDTYNAGIIDTMCQRIREGHDIVAASRFMKGGRMAGCPWLKGFFVRASAFTLYHFGRVPVHDSSNGFRMFSRRVVDQIQIESTRGFTYSIELLVKAHRLGWGISEVPAQWFERTRGASRFRVLGWLPDYLVWYFYAFGTTWLRRGPRTVPMKAS